MARQKGPSDEELVAADLQEQLKHSFSVHEKGLRLIAILQEIEREFNLPSHFHVTAPTDQGFTISFKDKWTDDVVLNTVNSHRAYWNEALEIAELHLKELITARDKAREAARARALVASKLSKDERAILGIDHQGNYTHVKNSEEDF